MPTPRSALIAALAAVAATVSLVPTASAAMQRHATPTGSGSACTSAEPCGVRIAVEGAAGGDEVIISPGDYSLGQTLSTYKPITVHGVPGRARPRLTFNGGGQFGFQILAGSTLRYVDVAQGSVYASAVGVEGGATVDQIRASASALGGLAVDIRDGEVRNSIAVASGFDGAALRTLSASGGHGSGTARNVTAIATGSGGVPALASANTAGSATLHLVNVIAYAGPGAISLRAQTDSSGAQATVTADHTDYQSVDQVGTHATLLAGIGNRAEEPAFVNAAAGDYRQAPGSYTIDAGIDYGGLDVDGDPRRIGTTDIGADEFVPVPTATTGAAGAATGQPATTTAQPFAGVRLASRRLAYARRAIPVRLRCPAETVGRCSGRTRLTTRRRADGRRVTLGRARFSIAPDGRATVRVRVTRTGRRLLARARRLRGRAITAARDGAGGSRMTLARVTIRRRHR